MNNDLKATVSGLVTGVAGVLSYFNIMIPDAWTTPIVLLGMVVIGFFANKKDKVKE